MPDPLNTDSAGAPDPFAAAIVDFRQGRVDAARAGCRRVLAAGDHFGALHLLGVIEARQGRFDPAEDLFRRAIALQPGRTEVRPLLASLLVESGRFGEALEACDEMLARAPGLAAARLLRGRALAGLDRLEEALSCFEAAAAADPGSAEAAFQSGRTAFALGRHDAALAGYDRALALKPDMAAGHCNRGAALRAMDRPEEALESLDRALAIAPGMVEAHLGRAAVLRRLGREAAAAESEARALRIVMAAGRPPAERAAMLRDMGRFEDALASCDEGLASSPGDLALLRLRGQALTALNRTAEALDDFNQVLAARPDDLPALFGRGAGLSILQRGREALADFQRILAASPGHAEALRRSGDELCDLGRGAEAAAAYEALLGRYPDYRRGRGKLMNIRLTACDWSGFEAAAAEIVDHVREGRATDFPFAFLAHSQDPADQLICARTWAAEKAPPSPAPVWTGERYRHDRIRLAYLSADFHYHPMAHLMAKLFETHDRDRFETYALSFGPPRSDAMRQRLEGAFDHFLDVQDQSDRQIADLVRQLEIDIAVDRKGFTRGARTGIFALRPAPIQVNYLAYPGTMGVPYMDYIIADGVVIPQGEEGGYSEAVVRLPDSYQATDNDRAIAAATPTRAACGLPETGFVFCSLNNNYKILPAMFDVWMRLLRQIEGSVLWLLVKNDEALGNLRREAAARGVSPDRLVFARHMTMADHLARHRLADLFLDTFPFTAHTTASDALWAGLPVLTCAGRTFASRVAASLLQAVGLPEMITRDLGQYEALALALARDPGRLAAIRARLANRRDRWPLFDSDRFRRHIEAAYVTMHERHQNGLPPEAFSVPALGPVPRDD